MLVASRGDAIQGCLEVERIEATSVTTDKVRDQNRALKGQGSAGQCNSRGFYKLAA